MNSSPYTSGQQDDFRPGAPGNPQYPPAKPIGYNQRTNFGATNQGGEPDVPIPHAEQTQRLPHLLKQKDETNADVKRWIDEYVDVLNRRIERAKIEEEREF